MQLTLPKTQASGAPANPLIEEVVSSRILVVDDQLMNRHMLCQLLKGHGLTVIEADSGRAAIDVVTHQSIDLVLLDINMPEMDGFEVLNIIRSRASESDLPVIMLTASTESDQVVRAFECGANDYVTKPIDVAVTLARIATHLKLRRSQAALRQSEERYSLVARGTNDGLWDWDLSTDHVYYSPRLLAMLDLDESEAVTSPDAWLSRIHADDQPNVKDELMDYLNGESPQFETELRMRLPDGSYRWMLCRGLAVRDNGGTPQRLAGSLTDITEGKVADGLTGLPNRVLFDERLRKSAEKNLKDPNCCFALIYLDLDNFKLINDSMGHSFGDELLVAVARRLEKCVPPADSFISRLGGDEFAVLLERIGAEYDPQDVARRILESVSAPFELGAGREVFASVSVGISVSTETGDNCADMLQEADTAMYHAKAQGKSCFQFFSPRMKERVTRRLEIENELRHAVECSDFHLNYQPIVRLPSGELAGFEALIRWDNENLGPVSPGEFIPVAEDTGLIVPIGRWVLYEACRQVAEWKENDLRFEDVSISVNLSSRQLTDEDLLTDIFAALGQSGLSATDLVIEITESAIMHNPESGATLLGELRDRGIRIAIDDFGTGYSSLACLHRLSLDLLKVDRSFVEKMTLAEDNKEIVGTIIALANRMNLTVVAEGIETAEQRSMLEEMSCGFAQGYYFSRPLPADRVPETDWQTVSRLTDRADEPDDVKAQ